jgi:hypothetical protein
MVSALRWRLWHAAYQRVVRSSFATVPLYRERWALDGRTDPVLVPGRTGTDGGAVPAEVIGRRVADLVPLAGGSRELDPVRGLGPVLRGCVPLPDRTVVAVGGDVATRPPTDLPRGIRGCLFQPDDLAGIDHVLRRRGTVVAVATTKTLDQLDGSFERIPYLAVDELDGGPYGVVADRMLGVLGGFRDCGRWHLDWSRVYVRATTAGLAVTLLTQRSPRLVDVLVAGGVPGEVAPCVRHGSPVLVT